VMLALGIAPLGRRLPLALAIGSELEPLLGQSPTASVVQGGAALGIEEYRVPVAEAERGEENHLVAQPARHYLGDIVGRECPVQLVEDAKTVVVQGEVGSNRQSFCHRKKGRDGWIEWLTNGPTIQERHLDCELERDDSPRVDSARASLAPGITGRSSRTTRLGKHQDAGDHKGPTAEILLHGSSDPRGLGEMW
jgi:hypothetical protein